MHCRLGYELYQNTHRTEKLNLETKLLESVFLQNQTQREPRCVHIYQNLQLGRTLLTSNNR